ncbi:hypothetical protein Lumi_018 [Xylophilus phage Lumi]|nr:hypothetical protein Lumi_018 [Xylophilus phage Lumi]
MTENLDPKDGAQTADPVAEPVAAPALEPYVAPAADITYTRDFEEVTLTMTYGLLNKLLGRIGSIENIALIGVNPTINDLILLEMLQKRDHKGKVIQPPVEDISDVLVSISDMEALTAFAQEHLLDFSFRTLDKSRVLMQKQGPRAKALSDLTLGLIGRLGLQAKS